MICFDEVNFKPTNDLLAYKKIIAKTDNDDEIRCICGERKPIYQLGAPPYGMLDVDLCDSCAVLLLNALDEVSLADFGSLNPKQAFSLISRVTFLRNRAYVYRVRKTFLGSSWLPRTDTNEPLYADAVYNSFGFQYCHWCCTVSKDHDRCQKDLVKTLASLIPSSDLTRSYLVMNLSLSAVARQFIKKILFRLTDLSNLMFAAAECMLRDKIIPTIDWAVIPEISSKEHNIFELGGYAMDCSFYGIHEYTKNWLMEHECHIENNKNMQVSLNNLKHWVFDNDGNGTYIDHNPIVPANIYLDFETYERYQHKYMVIIKNYDYDENTAQIEYPRGPFLMTNDVHYVVESWDGAYCGSCGYYISEERDNCFIISSNCKTCDESRILLRQTIIAGTAWSLVARTLEFLPELTTYVLLLMRDVALCVPK